MKTFSILTLLFILSSGLTNAQDTQLTYERAIKIALEQNIGLKQAKNNLRINEAERSQRIASFAPSVSFNVQASQIYGRQFDQATGLFTEQAQALNGGVNASLPLFNGFARTNTLKQSQKAVEQQYYQIERTRQDVIFNVSTQYLDVLINTELLAIAKANLKQQEELSGSIREFVDAGIRNIADLYNQEAEEKRVALTVVEARNNLNISKAQLFQTLQVDPLKTWNFDAPQTTVNELLTLQVELPDYYNKAMATRPDVKAQESQVAVSQRSITIAKADYWPSLEFGYYFGSRYSSLSPEGFNRQLAAVNDVNVFQLNLNVPVFNNLQTRTAVQRRQQQYRNAQLEKENLERTIFSQVQTAVADFEAARQRVIATKAQLRAAEKAREVEQERFRLGVGNLIDLNRANTAYIEAKSNKVQADYTLIFQKIVLDYFVGSLD